jgi:hypothetical protein
MWRTCSTNRENGTNITSLGGPKEEIARENAPKIVLEETE